MHYGHGHGCLEIDTKNNYPLLHNQPVYSELEFSITHIRGEDIINVKIPTYWLQIFDI